MSEQNGSTNKDHDAFGHEILKYWANEPVLEIVERSDGFISANDTVKNYFASFEDWPPFEQEGFDYLVPGRSLDLGCGAGRVELYLQERGHEITGIDNSPLAIRVCQERGVKDARLLPVEKINPNLGIFNNIIMYGNNWGLMGSREKARRILYLLYKMTALTARILAVSNDVYQTDNPVHLAYHASNRKRGRMSGQLRLRVRCEIYQSKWFDYLIVSRSEMEEILQGTGWRVMKYIDSQGSNYLAVIEKITR